jgi:selenocysteine lyase/cysteine desulfurase
MSISRRNFLNATGAAAAALTIPKVLPGALAGPRATSGSSLELTHPTDPKYWSYVRDQFELSRDHIHLSSFFLASHPRPVREAIEKHRHAIDENPLLYVEHGFAEMPAAVARAAAEYLGGQPNEVGLTNSTTMGLAFVYQGLPLKAGQEILTTTHDHYVHSELTRMVAERSGATVRKISLYDRSTPITEEAIVRRIRNGVSAKTRVVGITWVHSGSGVKLPIPQIAATIAELNRGRAEADRILLVVDGVHGIGVEDETIAQLGCDFFAAGTHKWLFGPRGTGIIWAKADSWKLLRPIFPAVDYGSFSGWMRGLPPQRTMEASWIGPGGFHAFEYEWALPSAFEFHQRMGRSNVAGRIHDLNDQLKEGLARMPHVKLYTPRGNNLSAGIVCFDIEGMKPSDVVERLLAKRIVASTSPYGDSCARLAPSLLNSPEEIEVALREVRALRTA